MTTAALQLARDAASCEISEFTINDAEERAAVGRWLIRVKVFEEETRRDEHERARREWLAAAEQAVAEVPTGVAAESSPAMNYRAAVLAAIKALR